MGLHLQHNALLVRDPEIVLGLTAKGSGDGGGRVVSMWALKLIHACHLFQVRFELFVTLVARPGLCSWRLRLWSCVQKAHAHHPPQQLQARSNAWQTELLQPLSNKAKVRIFYELNRRALVKLDHAVQW